MTVRSSKENAATVGQIIREHRIYRGITQKQFALELGVEARTLRMYENGERALENISDLRRIAELLQIEPARLGLADNADDPYTAETISTTVEQIAELIQQARLVEAQTLSEKLLRNLKQQPGTGEVDFLSAQARAHCIAGHIQAMTRKTREVPQIIQQYQQMELLARQLDNHSLLNLAVCFQADQLRRRGEHGRSLAALEKIHANTPLAEVEAQGYNMLCSARTHLSSKDYTNFFHAMQTAERLAEVDQRQNYAMLTNFNPGLLALEYARGYAVMGKSAESQDYLEQAEHLLPASTLWKLLLKITRAEALVYASDISNAMPLLIEVAHLAQMHGHQRLIERLYRLQYTLDDQAELLRRASRSLSEVLYGPVEHT